LEAFAMRLVDGVQEHRGRIDALLAESAVNWKVERMAAVDRAILRLGVYEMGVAHPPTPPRVVITEAVEIAKRFSTQDSARFVNGVLDRIAQTIPPAEQTNEDSTPADEHEVEDDPPTIDDPEQQ
jgi:N utilization substance protein B